MKMNSIDQISDESKNLFEFGEIFRQIYIQKGKRESSERNLNIKNQKFDKYIKYLGKYFWADDLNSNWRKWLKGRKSMSFFIRVCDYIISILI